MAGIGQTARAPFTAQVSARTDSWPWPDYLRSFACAWDVCRAAWLPPGNLGSLVRRRWQSLVAFARDRSAFYHELYAGVREHDLENLSALPIVTKTMIMSGFDKLVTSPALQRRALEAFIADPQWAGRPFAGGFAVWTSSGTSGEPGIFVHDASALAVYDALQLYRFRGAAASMELGVTSLALGRFALVAATGGHFAGAASVERLRSMFPWMAQRLRVITLMQPLDMLVAELNAYRPNLIATYPSAAAMLAQEQQAGRLRIDPTQVWTGGECLSEATRQIVQETFGADVRDEYGASEFASIAVGCPAGWLHVNADWVVLEPVDDQYQPVAPGQPSHTVLLTNLANRAQPLIRYDLGDSITVRADPCECGNRLPAIHVQGRGDDLLELHGRGGVAVQLLPLALTTVLEEGAGLYDFQLVQLGPRALRLHVGVREHAKADRARSALRGFLDCQGLDGVRIDQDTGPPRCRGAGGKLRRIIRESEQHEPELATNH